MATLIGGSIAIDHIKTPKAEAKDLLGGSAPHASLAASFFSEQVDILGIVGRDYPQHHLDMLAEHGVGLNAVERGAGDSFVWKGRYFENMNERETLDVALNVLEGWQVKVPAAQAGATVVVLANMSPANQLEMLEQCTAEKKFVMADTMDLWINIAITQLEQVLEQVDMLVLNESEARELTKLDNLVLAGKQLLTMGPKFVVVKLGEFGSMLFGKDGKISKTHAWPLEAVIDPTGAGDAFLGAMAGYLDALAKEVYTFEDVVQGMARGAVVSSYTCEAFSTQALAKASKEDVAQRLEQLQELSCW